MPSEYEEKVLEGGLGNIPMADISIEKPDPHWQTRSQPSVFPPHTGSPGKPVSDPMECRPPEVPGHFPSDVRDYFDFGQRVIEKTLGTTVEVAFGRVAERFAKLLAHAVNPLWLSPSADSQNIDVSVNLNTPVTLVAAAPAGTFTTVLTLGPFNSRTIAFVAAIGTALETAAAFVDVEWVIRRDGIAVQDVPGARVQWAEIANIWNGRFAKPIVLLGRQTLELAAGNRGAVNHTAIARFVGHSNQLPFVSSTITEALQSATQSSQRFVTTEGQRMPTMPVEAGTGVKPQEGESWE